MRGVERLDTVDCDRVLPFLSQAQRYLHRGWYVHKAYLAGCGILMVKDDW